MSEPPKDPEQWLREIILDWVRNPKLNDGRGGEIPRPRSESGFIGAITARAGLSAKEYQELLDVLYPVPL